METILDRIIHEKRIEVKKLREGNLIKIEAKPKRSFIEKLQNAKEIAIISEFKRASPSKGIINNGVEPAEQAAQYEQAGASAISVLTDSTFFKGSFADLRAVREVVDLPILCKDFIIDSCQIDMAAGSGADLILLIVAALDEDTLSKLYQYARSLDLEVLVEVHNQDELEKALKLGAQLIGVNNRDLKTFEVSLEATEALAKSIKGAGAFLISESGIHHKADVERVRSAGANAILVGEALMKSPNLSKSFDDFKLPLCLRDEKMKVKICGITDLTAALAAVDYGADAIGFVFAESKRKIDVTKAKDIALHLPKEVFKVGVFVNESKEKIEEIASSVGLTHVQLHGDETPAFCDSLSFPIIKAISIHDEQSLKTIENYSCEYILLDGPKGKYRGGNGLSFDWKSITAKDLKGKKVILAGGLHEDNVEEAIKQIQPFMVDVSSGVETDGKKDLDKIQSFINKAKGSQTGGAGHENIYTAK